MLLPLLVTRLIARPPDCTETSPPPVVTWIWSNESKLKYDGEEFDDRSVIDPPSRFHCTLAVEPQTDEVDLLARGRAADVVAAHCTPGVMLMICQGSRAVGIFSRMSAVNVAPVVVFLVSTTGRRGGDRDLFGHLPDLELLVDAGVEAGGDDDVRAGRPS